MSVFISFLLFFGPDLIFYKFSITYVIFSNFLFTTLSSVFGLYNSIIRFSGINDIEKIFKVFLIFFICSFVVFIFHNTELQVIFLFFQTLISLLFIIIFRRLSYKVLKNWFVNYSSKKLNIARNDITQRFVGRRTNLWCWSSRNAKGCCLLIVFFDNNQEVKVVGFLR